MEDEKRLIDANKLSEQMAVTFEQCVYDGVDSAACQIALDTISEASTVDAVEVVRCKDCMKYRDPFCLLNDTQSGYLTAVSPDHFCSCGEKENDYGLQE